MSRFIRWGISVVCASAFFGFSLGSVLRAVAEQPVFRGGSDVVRVYVTVTDKDGHLVTSLTQDKFEVRDEGKPQPITQFDNTPLPLRLIVLLDVSGSMEGNLPLLRAAGAQLFGRLRPDDLARVGSFGNEITIGASFTRDPKELDAALPESIPPNAPTPLWRAIDQAMDLFRPGSATTKSDRDGALGAPDGRREDFRKAAARDGGSRTDGGSSDAEGRPVILVMTDGKDEDAPSFRHRMVSQAEVIERARREDVMIYGVGMRSRSSQPRMPGFGPGGLQAMLTADLPDPGLARVAEETGGGYTEIRFGQDLGAAFAAVADELHTQYLLGFAPSSHDGKIHKINVRMTQGSQKPRARKSYVAPRT